MTKGSITELRRLEAEAHPGPWERAYHKVVFTHPEHWKGLRAEVRGTMFTGIECHAVTRQVDAEFVAALRNSARQLLDDAERLATLTEFMREHGSFVVHAIRIAETASYDCGAVGPAVEFGRTRVALEQALATVPQGKDGPRIRKIAAALREFGKGRK